MTRLSELHGQPKRVPSYSLWTYRDARLTRSQPVRWEVADA